MKEGLMTDLEKKIKHIEKKHDKVIGKL